MESVLCNLSRDADEIKGKILQLGKYSKIYDIPTTRGEGFTVVGHSGWSELPSEGKRIQADLKERYLHHSSIMASILKDAPAKVRSQFDEAGRIVWGAIEQQGIYPSRDAFREACEALDRQLEVLSCLARPADASVVVAQGVVRVTGTFFHAGHCLKADEKTLTIDTNVMEGCSFSRNGGAAIRID